MSTLRTPAVKAWQLRYWAFLTGMQTTGTKAELQAILTSRLDNPLPAKRPTKIISVDMGIRNLAYCAIEAPALDLHAQDVEFNEDISKLNRSEKEILRQHPSANRGSSKTEGLRKRLDNQAITVTAWKRMDLTANEQTTHDLIADDKESSPSKLSSQSKPPPEIFTPSNLSRTALTLTHELLSHNPTTILLERQRFRSGGGAAIQEWTVRVNMLESMIWACLETLRSKHITSSNTPPFPSIHAINPTHVVNFNSSPASISLLPPTLFHPDPTPALQHTLTQSMSTRTKMEKKDKVALVQKWCSQFGVDAEVPMKFNDATWPVACAFKGLMGSKRKARMVVGGKLDDVADCLVQAVTWVRWERNRRVLAGLWRKAVEDANMEEGDVGLSLRMEGQTACV